MLFFHISTVGLYVQSVILKRRNFFEELSISFCSHRKETTLNYRRLLESTIVDKLGKIVILEHFSSFRGVLKIKSKQSYFNLFIGYLMFYPKQIILRWLIKGRLINSISSFNLFSRLPLDIR